MVPNKKMSEILSAMKVTDKAGVYDLAKMTKEQYL